MKKFEKFLKNSSLKNKANFIFYVCCFALPVLQFLIFYVAVNVNSILLAFKKYFPDGTYELVWFSNIVQVVKDFISTPTLRVALSNSFKAYLASLLMGTTCALFFSYYVFKKFPMHKFFRIFLFLPQIVSSVVMVLVYGYTIGNLIPEIANKLFNVQMVGLLDNPNTAFGSLIFYSLWVGFGTSTLLYTGAMANISESVMEAAKLDGAGFFVEFFRIVFPLIFSTFITFIVTGLAAIFTAQLELFSFFQESAEFNLYTVGYFMYLKTLKAVKADFPYLSAMGLTITLVVAPITLTIRWLLEKYGPSTER